MPSEDMGSFMEKAEKVFKEVNGASLSQLSDPIGRVSSLLKRRLPEVEPEVVEKYSRARFYLRLNELNKKDHVAEVQRKRRRAQHLNKYLTADK